MEYFPKSEDRVCPLCLGVRDKLYNILEIGSQESLREGLNLSAIANLTPSSGTGLNGDVEKKGRSYFSNESLEKFSLCFGCRRIYENAKNPDDFLLNLPSEIKEKIRDLKSRFTPGDIQQFISQEND